MTGLQWRTKRLTTKVKCRTVVDNDDPKLITLHNQDSGHVQVHAKTDQIADNADWLFCELTVAS